ncbi:MAG: hypothetical protein IJU76_12875 [Desulfovibrionaceae bacterium]|nr:hypothetical protein [Desulfovibrionaceae bacterium]
MPFARLIFPLTCTLFFLIFCVFSTEGHCAQTQEKEWTIMVYLDGDNNLEHAALLDFLEMEQSIPEGVEILVLFDRSRGHSNYFGNWTGTRLYRVRRAQPFNLERAASGADAPLPAAFASELLEDWGEVDMADPATLTRFITVVAERYPAKRYALVPWNHGSGASSNGMLNDEDGGKGVPGRGSMSSSEFIQAAILGAKHLPKKRFDLVKYELCLMGQLDVMAETALVADFALASPPVEPSQGSDYLRILPWFRAGVSTEELTRKMVDINIDFYTKLGRPAAFSAFNLAHIPAVLGSFKELSARLMSLSSLRSKELTRATCFATHYEDLLEDLTRGKRAISSVEVYDWFDHLEKDLPEITERELASVRKACRDLVYHTKTTPNFPECRGVTVYLPLRREFEHSSYRASLFARQSGMAQYLSALYKAQESAGRTKPVISNVVLGRPLLPKGKRGDNPNDFIIQPVQYLSPFSRNVVRFDISGTGILLTKLLQFEERGGKRYLHYEQLVVDLAAKGNPQSSLFSSLSPVYADGTTTLLREISQQYKVSNGSQEATISIVNASVSRDIAENVSIGFGLYRDQTTGNQSIPVLVHFSNRLRIPIKTFGYQIDAQGNVNGMRTITFRPDGFFRPAVRVFDAFGRETKEYGPELPLRNGILLLTLDMIDEGARVGCMITAETMNGTRASAGSISLPVRHDPRQTQLRDAARAHGLENLFGRYAMIQLASSGADAFIALPTFQTVQFIQQYPVASFVFRDEQRETGSGVLNWLPFGTPQINLHKRSNLPGIPFGETVQTWYTFLQGSGKNRVWYCIGMGDGTRWALVPLESYQGNPLEGVWTSATEQWSFQGNTVRLSREGRTYEGSYQLNGHILSATNLPFGRYAVYKDQDGQKLTLMTRDGHVSLLTRKAQTMGASLLGNWIGQSGQERLNVASVPNTQFINLSLMLPGQMPIVCTCAQKDHELFATFQNGSHAVLSYTLQGNSLTVAFPMLPVLHFVRQ